MNRISIPWRTLLVLICLLPAICAQASAGSGRFKITWSTEADCVLAEPAQTIKIDLLQHNRLITSITAQRPTDCEVSTVNISDLTAGRYIFQATAFASAGDCDIEGGVIGRAWGYFDASSRRLKTVNLTVETDEGLCLRIEPSRPVIFPGRNTSRRLYAFAQNSDGAAVILPPCFVWSSANPRQANVDPLTGVVTGWPEVGNVNITVVNTAVKLRARTLVLVRDWLDSF